MPTYEYACTACGHQFEEFQSITSKPLTVCPVCKKKKVKRLISAGAGFIFKGSGFYITDYRSDSYKDAAKKDSGASTASETKSEPAKTNGTTAATPAPAPAPAPAAKTESKSSSNGKKQK